MLASSLSKKGERRGQNGSYIKSITEREREREREREITHEGGDTSTLAVFVF